MPSLKMAKKEGSTMNTILVTHKDVEDGKRWEEDGTWD